MLFYIDDILVISSSFQEHLQHLELVFHKLRKASFILETEKYHFAVEKVLYLGHIVTKDGVFVDENKKEKVINTQTPNHRYRFAVSLGCNYYLRFVDED